jgi:hypothetical protein
LPEVFSEVPAEFAYQPSGGCHGRNEICDGVSSCGKSPNYYDAGVHTCEAEYVPPSPLATIMSGCACAMHKPVLSGMAGTVSRGCHFDPAPLAGCTPHRNTPANQ